MRRGGVREALGWLSAAAIGLAIAGQVAQTARADLLFRDGDSLVVALFVRSVLEGRPLDWGMSSVLFLPESAAFAALTPLPLGIDGLFALSAVLNVVALYGAVRLVAGRRREGAAPVGWSLTVLVVYGVFAITETSASRDSFELASLLLTTTYYSAAVLATIAAVGILRRALDRSAHDGLGVVLPVSLGVLTLVSTLTNPLFIGWAVAPLGLLLGVLAARASLRRTALVLLATLLAGSVAGLLLRIPFQEWITKTGVGYAQPAEWLASLGYYTGFALARLTTPVGVLAALLLTALIVLAVWQSVRVRDVGARLVATSAWLLPLAVVIGGIALGTHATRYLQPALFAPLLALVAAPRVIAVPRSRVLFATAATALLALSVVSIPRLTAAATRPDDDLDCVTDWVDASGRTGGGQFWTVRLPKLHLQHPEQLVQLHSDLDAYGWLVNRTDYEVGEVSFLVDEGADDSWQLPQGAQPETIIPCGRYRILDFGSELLQIGPSRV